METFWSWAGGAALVGLAWLLRTIYQRRKEGKPPILDPENTVPALDIPRDAIRELISEWFEQQGMPAMLHKVGDVRSELRNHVLLNDVRIGALEKCHEEHKQKVDELAAKIPEPKKKR